MGGVIWELIGRWAVFDCPVALFLTYISAKWKVGFDKVNTVLFKVEINGQNWAPAFYISPRKMGTCYAYLLEPTFTCEIKGPISP